MAEEGRTQAEVETPEAVMHNPREWRVMISGLVRDAEARRRPLPTSLEMLVTKADREMLVKLGILWTVEADAAKGW
jgi:hypothetical protein